MVGAYGTPGVNTPNLDRLAAEGIRFNKGYTTSPVCTPARGALFTGLYPQNNGAYCNNLAPHSHVALMGEIFSHYGYRTGYTGKWHLDGSGYFGDGQPGGGFEPDWWYDGKRYLSDIGPEMAAAYRQSYGKEYSEEESFALNDIWGHRVADRAVDFLEKAGDQPFVLAVSFDEPHGPSMLPAEWQGSVDPSKFEKPINFNAPLDGKPELHHIQRAESGEVTWEEHLNDIKTRKLYDCNSYIDSEIGRVLDAVRVTHGDDTVVIYTSDHGDQLRSHGLVSKGPMMYEETCNIPFIVRVPNQNEGSVSDALVSHLDIIPTMLDLAGIEIPECLDGVSFKKTLESPEVPVRDDVLVSFHRFAVNHDAFGGFYPIRCLTDGRHKLIINLLDTDELYDLQEDPGELHNLIEEEDARSIRDKLHDRLLQEMDRVRDPFRTAPWARRIWRAARKPFYFYGENNDGQRRGKPKGFPFQPDGIEG